MEWQPIETAPDDCIHARGVWVYSAQTGEPVYFASDIGYVCDDGSFMTTSGDDTGWLAEDYEYWFAIPKNVPEPAK